MGLVVFVTGAAGFIGQAFVVELLKRGVLETGGGFPRSIEALVLADLVEDIPVVKGYEEEERLVRRGGVDIREEGAFAALLDEYVDDEDALSVFHLGGIASGDGERDDRGADLALDINFLGTRAVMTALRDWNRRTGIQSRFVFTSTNAVFGPTETITDDSKVMPRTSYGTAKAMCELLINDWSRRGFLDGRCTRMPAVIPRTTPNASAASAWSEVIAKPYDGVTADLSVPMETLLPVISIFRMMDNLIRLHNIPDEVLGDDRVVVMPALPISLAEAAAEVEAVFKQRGRPVPIPVASYEEDPQVARIVKDWPPQHAVSRAFELGWGVDRSVAEIITLFIENRTALP
mmetsp:Transcript_18640/g.74937  ORF Transcript_18640/g.74937 Transcript_18640/m.74937 type:complete len:347 (+) Transcript_18640:3261-4301(+)